MADKSGTKYFEIKEHFADLLNGYLYKGQQYILPEHIHERNRSKVLSYTKDNKKHSTTIYRDVIREVNVRMKTAVITLEHQTDIHYAMPVRIMAGDAALYYEQWRGYAREHSENGDLTGAEYLSGFSITDKLTPVSTIVVYFGDKPWNGPRSLKEMLNLEGFSEEMKNAIADYPMHLIEVRTFPDYDKFQTDLRLVFGFLQRDSDPDALRTYIEENAKEFSSLDEGTYELISHYSRSQKLMKEIKTSKNETGGVDMCKAIDDLIARGEERGEARGEARGKEYGIKTAIKLCQEFGISADATVYRIVEEFSLSEANAKEYITKYWS